jgi:hypothetical protein
MTRTQDAMRALFGVKKDRTGNLPPMPGIFPDYPAPIIRLAEGERKLATARWGMPSPAFTSSPHWRRWLGTANRCIVPFTSFSEYETRQDGKKSPVWYRFGRGSPPDELDISSDGEGGRGHLRHIRLPDDRRQYGGCADSSKSHAGDLDRRKRG